MKVSTDISRFDKISDYLPILNLFYSTDLFLRYIILHTITKKQKKKRWYDNFFFSLNVCSATSQL